MSKSKRSQIQIWNNLKSCEHIILSKISSFLCEKCFSVLKEEPDDTAHYTLSPSPTTSANNFVAAATDNNGPMHEPCLPPLDDAAPLFGEIFDELILPDGYGTLLADDITTSIDSQSSKINIDPFMSYRDESCDTVGTPNILSPETLSKVHRPRSSRK